MPANYAEPESFDITRLAKGYHVADKPFYYIAKGCPLVSVLWQLR
jgi:hypothetical protein